MFTQHWDWYTPYRHKQTLKLRDVSRRVSMVVVYSRTLLYFSNWFYYVEFVFQKLSFSFFWISKWVKNSKTRFPEKQIFRFPSFCAVSHDDFIQKKTKLQRAVTNINKTESSLFVNRRSSSQGSPLLLYWWFHKIKLISCYTCNCWSTIVTVSRVTVASNKFNRVLRVGGIFFRPRQRERKALEVVRVCVESSEIQLKTKDKFSFV